MTRILEEAERFSQSAWTHFSVRKYLIIRDPAFYIVDPVVLIFLKEKKLERSQIDRRIFSSKIPWPPVRYSDPNGRSRHIVFNIAHVLLQAG